MWYKYLILFSFLLVGSLHAQILQKGIVLEMNSQKKPVSNVKINVQGSQPTYSAKDGIFSFYVSETKQGDQIKVREVSRPNYVVSNQHEIFERWIITNDANPWYHRVEIAHKDSIKKWQDCYKQQAEISLRNEFNRQLNLIRKSFRTDSISKQEYLFRINKLESENRILNSQLIELSERFANINRDFALSFVNKALNEYLDGNFTKAIQLIDSIDVVKGLEIADLNLKNNLRNAADALDNKMQWIEAVKVKARLFNNQFNKDSASFYFGKAFLYDSLNYSTVVEYGVFLEERLLQYEKAISCFSKAIILTNNDFNKATLLCNIGFLKNKLNGSISDVSKPYFDALNLLLKKDSIDESEKRLISSLFINLGNLQKDGRHYDDAEETFLSGVKTISEIAYSSKKQSDQILLAQYLTELGKLRIEMRKTELGENDLKESFTIFEKVNQEDSIPPIGLIKTLNALGKLYLLYRKPGIAEAYIAEAVTKCRKCLSADSLYFSSLLSQSLDLMGNCQMLKGDFICADSSLKESLTRMETLVAISPDAYNPELAMILNDNALVDKYLGRQKEAVNYNLRSLEINRVLSFEKFEVYDVAVVDVLNELSELLFFENKYNEAESALLESLFLCYKLKYSWTDSYDLELFETYRHLSDLYIRKKNYKEAQMYIEESFIYCNKLITNGYSEFMLEKAKLYSDLGWIQSSQNALTAIKTAEKGISLIKPMVDDSPKNKSELALMYYRLSHYYMLKKKKRIAEEYAQLSMSSDSSFYTNKYLQQTLKKNEDVTQSMGKDTILYINDNIANLLGSISYYMMLEHKYKLAEYFAKKGLALDPDQHWINSNLALSLLLQGNFKDAKQIYSELKNKPYLSDKTKTFNSILLKDLDDFEQAGISHPDMIKIRKLLVN